jgi:phospholipase C
MSLIEGANATSKSPVSWHVYYEGVPGPAIFLNTATKYLDNFALMRNFYDDAAAGMLANLNVLDANIRDEWGGGDDFHPPSDPQVGDQFLATVVQALMASPQWPHMALFITFDEHGGLYDHVPPPRACAPDNLLPVVKDGETPYDFAQYGFRVPLIVISPYAKPHYVSHVVSDHTSITRFVEARFHLPAMSARDANADPLYDLFDFTKPALLTPPALPTPTPDAQKLADCQAQFPLKSTNYFPDMAGQAPPDMGM